MRKKETQGNFTGSWGACVVREPNRNLSGYVGHWMQDQETSGSSLLGGSDHDAINRCR